MRHIRDCFNTKFNQVRVQAQQLDVLTATVKRYLPELLHPHCRALGFQNGCLILSTPDATWTSQLRYLLPELRDQLRAQEKWYQLTAIKIVIDVEPSPILLTKQRQAPPEKTSPWKQILQDLCSKNI